MHKITRGPFRPLPGHRDRARVRRQAVRGLRRRLVVHQAQSAPVPGRDREKRRAQVDPGPVAETQPCQRGRRRSRQLGNEQHFLYNGFCLLHF